MLLIELLNLMLKIINKRTDVTALSSFKNRSFLLGL